ncbi:hypothetical protein SAMN04487944_110146 [Gracilibacillus ureilyticus]|uniref:Uncharacterized protein n=1 Tax=Gracilibacillus ureilyticus TaxID=531814 RepID=A0A1H9S9C2_9BACI|nr:hypothetical protein [Gracilibacillus ureilyticus]SER81607.1 hypothetical protein SAMN04487944_110146 [Gracilibacillus ureilyticus]
MFLRKKREEEHEDNYAVTIFYESDYDEEIYDQITDRLLIEGEMLGVTQSMQMTEEYKKMITQKFPDREVNFPGLAILDFDTEQLKENYKAMEKKHKWKNFFGMLTIEDYFKVEEELTTDYEKTLLYTTDVDEAIHFMLERSYNK